MNNKVPAVEIYLQQDYSIDGSAAQRLLSQVETEKRQTDFQLTDLIGSLPANMTPSMKAWYSSQVAAKGRQSALDSLDTLLSKDEDETGKRGVFLERELDEIRDTCISMKRQVLHSQGQQYQAAQEQVAEARQGYQKARNIFNEFHAKHNRSPKTPNKLLYLFVMILIGITEWLINFETFSALEWSTPAIATGMTLVVAASLAFGSHNYGVFLKQFKSYFGAHRQDQDRHSAWTMFSIGTVCLSVALSLVAYARDSYFSDILLEQQIMGGEAASWLKIVGGSMLSNLLVAILGIMFAWWVHDEDHKYPKAYDDKQIAERKFRKLQSQFEQPLQRKYEQIDAKTDLDITQVKTKHDSLENDDNYLNLRLILAQIKEQDAKVLGVLETYRSLLIQAIDQEEIVFRAPSELPNEGAKLLSPYGFAAETLRMKYN